MKKHYKFYQPLFFILIFFVLILLNSCICNRNKIDVAEGRVLYQEELNIIPYKVDDIITFKTNTNEIHKFFCNYRNHHYDKGQPTFRSHNECEGQTLRSQDRLTILLSTDLTTYYYNYVQKKIIQEDSATIYLNIYSSYYDDSFSVFSFNIERSIYGGACLFTINNELSFQNYCSPPSTDFNNSIFYQTISINNITYYKVLCIEDNSPNTNNLPYTFNKVYFNEEFGIIQIVRSDGIVYNLVQK